MKNLLFIPCYRCAPQIVRVLEDIKDNLHSFDEVLVIDNVSPDQTVEVTREKIKELQLSKIRIVQNSTNVNLGGSHKLAFQYAIENNFDHIVILHGDDQGTLGDFNFVLNQIAHQKMTNFVMGARFHSRSKIIGYSKFRIFGNLCFNFVSSILKGRIIYDLGGSGLNLFPVNLLHAHPFKTYSNDLTFHVYLLLNAYKLKQRVTFSPITWREDDQISNVKLFRQALRLLRIITNDLMSSKRLLKSSESEFPFHPSEWKSL